jgi:Chemotaxis signal transduction protein
MENQEKIIIDADDSEFDSQKEAKPTIRVLSFRLGTEHYCINITDAREVFKPVSITRIPNTPAFIVGVTNLHGRAIPLIDIRYFLGLGQKEGLAGTKVIVTDAGHNVVGVMVDDVDETLDIEEALIQPPLATIKGKLAEFTKGQMQLGTEILVFAGA